MVKAIGPRWARALFASAESFDANFAYQIGLVQYVVDSADELGGMDEYLVKLGFGAAPGAIADAKELVDDVYGQKIDTGLMKNLAKRIAHRRTTEEGQEGLTAFLEKRKPNWAE